MFYLCTPPQESSGTVWSLLCPPYKCPCFSPYTQNDKTCLRSLSKFNIHYIWDIQGVCLNPTAKLGYLMGLIPTAILNHRVLSFAVFSYRAYVCAPKNNVLRLWFIHSCSLWALLMHLFLKCITWQMWHSSIYCYDGPSAFDDTHTQQTEVQPELTCSINDKSQPSYLAQTAKLWCLCLVHVGHYLISPCHCMLVGQHCKPLYYSPTSQNFSALIHISIIGSAVDSLSDDFILTGHWKP